MSGKSHSAIAFVLMLYAAVAEGTLTLTLEGYDSIPTDGTGRILYSDIGTDRSNSLICRTDVFSGTTDSNWYYNADSLSTAEEDRIDLIDRERGWINGPGFENGFRLQRLRSTRTRDVDGNPLEGVFTCEIVGDSDSPISVGVYYPITVDVRIDVVSARELTFTATCTATGGTVLDSRFNGIGFTPATLAPVGTLNRRGNDTYSFTTPVIRHVDPDSGFPRGDRDIYFCRASNGLSSRDPSDFSTLRVAGPPTIISARQVRGTIITVSWSAPSRGAPVADYVVHYADNRDSNPQERPVSFVFNSVALVDLINDGRTYTISVEARSFHLSGESASVDVVLSQPDPPTGVAVSDIQPHSVRVSWDNHPDADSYIVQYDSLNFIGNTQLGACSDGTHSGSVTIDGSTTSVIVGEGRDPLRAFTAYSFTVVAVNDTLGMSTPSNPPSVIRTLQTGATVPPSNIMAMVQSSTSILVQWDGLSPCIEVNGDIVQYTIRYQPLPSGTVETVEVPGVWDMGGQVLLSGLTPFTDYSIEVAAVNSQGDVGVFSEPVTGRTDEDSPGPVVVSSSTTPFSITITWEPPEMPNGVIIAYEVSYWPRANPDDVTAFNTSALFTTLRGLQPETQYTFTVRAYTQVGAGQSSTRTRTTEVQTAPVPVIISSSATPFSITITWEPPELLNGVIIAYEVSYWPTADPEDVTTMNTTDLATTVTVSGLQPETQYTLTVRAYTRAGAGESRTVTETTSVGPDTFIQLRLNGITNCPQWVRERGTEKLMDVTSAILQLVQDSCQCVYGQSEVDGELFRCFDGSEDFVTYRARLLATAEVDTQSLVSSLEEFVRTGNSVMVESAALMVDSDCGVEISSLRQEECGAQSVAVAGGVLAVSAVIAALL